MRIVNPTNQGDYLGVIGETVMYSFKPVGRINRVGIGRNNDMTTAEIDAFLTGQNNRFSPFI